MKYEKIDVVNITCDGCCFNSHTHICSLPRRGRFKNMRCDLAFDNKTGYYIGTIFKQKIDKLKVI